MDLITQLLDSLSLNGVDIPKTVECELQSLALAGYSKIGDVDNAEKVFCMMREQGLSLRYASRSYSISEYNMYLKSHEILLRKLFSFDFVI